jgi:hypothetical protein
VQDLLSLLQEHTRQIVADCAAATRNQRAMSAMADDILGDMERRGHREFGSFTPKNGRA